MFVALAACGDNHSAPVDAAVAVDAATAGLVASPAVLGFGGVLVGQTSAESAVTFTNTGSVASGALSLALGGTAAARFAILSSTCSGVLAAGATCTMKATFSPTAAVSATLTLSDGIASVASTATGSGRS